MVRDPQEERRDEREGLQRSKKERKTVRETGRNGTLGKEKEDDETKMKVSGMCEVDQGIVADQEHQEEDDAEKEKTGEDEV